MAQRSVAVILIAAIGGLFLAGCECNSGQFPGLYDNLNGSDWRHTMKDLGHECDAALDHWDSRAVASLSGLNDNLNGADWRHSMKELGYEWDAAFDGWTKRAAGSVSGLNDNLNGADWREYVAGSCGEPAGASPAAPPPQEQRQQDATP